MLQFNSQSLAQSKEFILGLDSLSEYNTGDIQIKSNSYGDVIVLVNAKDSAQKRIYILQGSTDKLNINERITNGELIYLYNALIINSLTGKKRYYFAVSVDQETKLYKSLPDIYKSFFDQKIYGYGLVRIKGNLPGNLEIFKENSDPFSDLDYYHKASTIALATPLITCIVGGPGSQSCTITISQLNYSVTCNTGYYACCTYTAPFGRCIPNGE